VEVLSKTGAKEELAATATVITTAPTQQGIKKRLLLINIKNKKRLKPSSS
jgi:hypothetical protein